MNWTRPLRALIFTVLGCHPSSSAAREPRAPLPDPLLAEVVQGNTTFAFELYARLRESPKNLFFSPASISTALAMTLSGARGTTASEMANALHVTLEPRRRQGGFARLLATLNEREAPPERDASEGGSSDPEEGLEASGPALHIANRLWCQSGLTLDPTFERVTRELYRSPLTELDFRRSPEPSRGAINRWVEDETHGKITDLLPPGAITQASRLVLTNAIYFKGAWASPFSRESTRDEPFFTAPTRSRPVPMMHQRLSADYAEIGSAKVLRLPYAPGKQGRALAMLFVLPDARGGLPALESGLDEQALSTLQRGLHKTEVLVALPRFRVSSTLDLSLPLRQLGMERAFTAKADFSGIATGLPLWLSQVVHKAFVDVDEAGTEAAAATGVVVTTTSLVVGPRPSVFRADHPFLMLLVEETTGSILFLGRVVDPAASAT